MHQRLLVYYGSAFPKRSIEVDVLIEVDVSMVDVTLTWHLFQADDLAQTSFMLVGDHIQIPQVGRNILHDQIRLAPRRLQRTSVKRQETMFLAVTLQPPWK